MSQPAHSTIPNTDRNHTHLLVAGAFAIVSLILFNKLCVLFNSLGSDAGVFLLGARLLDAGQVPYTDFWTNKPPGIFFILQAALHFPLSPVLGATLLETLVAIATSLVTFLFLRHFTSVRYSILGTIIVAAISTSNRFADGGILTESYLNLLELGTAFLLIAGVEKTGALRIFMLALAGSITWVAFLVKPVGIGPYLAACAWLAIIWCLEPGNRKNALAALATLSAGLAVSIALTLPFQSVFGSFSDLIYAAVGYNLHYASAGHQSSGGAIALLEGQLRILKWSLPLFLVPVLIAPRLLSGYWRNTEQQHIKLVKKYRVLIYLGLWTLADSAGAMLSGYAYAHYFIPLQLPLSILAIIAFDVCRKHYSHTLTVIVAVLIFTSLAGNSIESLMFTFRQMGRAPLETIALLLENPAPANDAVNMVRRTIIFGTAGLTLATVISIYYFALLWNKAAPRTSEGLTNALYPATVFLLASFYFASPNAYAALKQLDIMRQTSILEDSQWIRQQVPAGNTVLVWNHSLELYHQGNRNPSQRLLTMIHFTEMDDATMSKAVEGMLSELRSAPPAIVLDRTRPGSVIPQLHCGIRLDESRIKMEFPRLLPVNDYICSNYSVRHLADGGRVYFYKTLHTANQQPYPGEIELPQAPEKSDL